MKLGLIEQLQSLEKGLDLAICKLEKEIDFKLSNVPLILGCANEPWKWHLLVCFQLACYIIHVRAHCHEEEDDDDRGNTNHLIHIEPPEWWPCQFL